MNGAACYVLAEGLHPAHDALSRRVRNPASSRGDRDAASGIHDEQVLAIGAPARWPGATKRSSRRATSRSALQGRARGAPDARLRDDARVPRALRPVRVRGDGPAAAPQSGVMTRAELEALWLVPPRWGSCSRRRRSGSGRRAGRTWPRRQDPDAASRDAPSRGEPRSVHDRDPQRDRRDAPRADRRPPRLEGARQGAQARQEVIVQNFRAKAARGWPRPSRRSTTTSGRSRSRASCSAPGGTCRRRRTSPSTTSHASSTLASTTGAASRR